MGAGREDQSTNCEEGKANRFHVDSALHDDAGIAP